MRSRSPPLSLERLIYFVRGHRVMFDADLARLYGVTTFNLNKAVSRNKNRFPVDFAFRLTREEHAALRFQFGILKRGQHAKYLPRVFTEQGVAMLSGVLRSLRAVEANIAIMRAFVTLRGMVATNKELARRLDALERRYDSQFKVVFDAIRGLMAPPTPPRRRIGFDP